MLFNFLDHYLGNIDSDELVEISHDGDGFLDEIFISDQSVEWRGKMRSPPEVVLHWLAVPRYVAWLTSEAWQSWPGPDLKSRVSYQMDDLRRHINWSLDVFFITLREGCLSIQGNIPFRWRRMVFTTLSRVNWQLRLFFLTENLFEIFKKYCTVQMCTVYSSVWPGEVIYLFLLTVEDPPQYVVQPPDYPRVVPPLLTAHVQLPERLEVVWGGHRQRHQFSQQRRPRPQYSPSLSPSRIFLQPTCCMREPEPLDEEDLHLRHYNHIYEHWNTLAEQLGEYPCMIRKKKSRTCTKWNSTFCCPKRTSSCLTLPVSEFL